MKINLGYCCISVLYPKLKCNRSSTKTYLDSHDDKFCHDYLLDKAKNNLKNLVALLYSNYENGILAYRLPEQILPQIDLGYYKIEELKEELKMAGQVANKLNMQLSTHPSQYYVLNSHRVDVVDKTISALNLFSKTFEMMELNRIPNMTLHVGAKNGYDSKEMACNVFVKNYNRLGQAAKNYLVVENDHSSFDVEDCLLIHELCGIPVVFDNMHYQWNPGRFLYEECVVRVVETWGNRIPKFHLSSDREGNKHAHHDMVNVYDYRKLEKALLRTKVSECYVMLECKQKDRAILELRKKRKEWKKD